MPPIDRREFLQYAAGAALGIAAGSTPVRPPGRPAVVCVFLRGGVDGLSLVVPHGDPLFYRRRPRIAIASRDVIDLNGYFGLHPALAPLRHWWDNGSLTIAPAAGFPSRTRSHLDAQERVDRWLERTGAVVVNSWGWDTHLNQRAALDARLHGLARELDAFARAADPRMRDVVVITISEFGRTVRENAYGGTDHGHATALLAFGGPVARGIRGGWPGLETESADIAVTTDVRDLFDAVAPLHTGASHA